MEAVARIGTVTACCGVLFFLVCVGLVFWYLFKQKPQVAADDAPEPLAARSIEHPSAGTPGADG